MKLDQTKTHGVFSNGMPSKDARLAAQIEGIVKKGGGWAGGWFCSVGDHAITHALYSWYVDHDLTAAKQWFYIAAKCIAISTTKPVGFATLWTCHDFMFPLLSDSPEMVALFATLSPPGLDDKPSFADKRENPREGEFQSYLVQTAIKGDDQKLAELIALFKAKSLKKNAKFNNAYIMCNTALIRGDEVQVDSPLVPMAFMPVAPLPHYDDVYEFLKPGWQAPPPPEPEKKGFFAKLFGK